LGLVFTPHPFPLVSLKIIFLRPSDTQVQVHIEADDYASNESKNATYRALLVNRVVVGKANRRRRNAQHLTAPPPGYQSVSDRSLQSDSLYLAIFNSYLLGGR